MAACPAGVDARAMLVAVAAGGTAAAWRILSDHNPLPGVCGRLCEAPCEARCVRATSDEPVGIRDVERHVADLARRLGWRAEVTGLRVPPRTVAVVGAGPAGLSAAWHLARRGCGVTVFDDRPHPGGRLRYGAPAWRLPAPVLEADLAAVAEVGVRFTMRTRVRADLTAIGGFDAVVVATGRPASPPPALPGHHLPGVQPALTWLEALAAGATPALPPRVAVIGDDRVAVAAARAARRLGAAPTLVARRDRAAFAAAPDDVAQAEAEGVRILERAVPLRCFAGHERVAGVQCQVRRAPGADGPAENLVVEAGAVFTTPSYAPDRVWPLPWEEDLDAPEWSADWWGRTRDPMVFVAGACAGAPASVAHAIASGRRAAEAVLARFHGGSLPEPGPLVPVIEREDLSSRAVGATPRQRPPARAPREAASDLAEVVGTMETPEARAEASRCLACCGP